MKVTPVDFSEVEGDVPFLCKCDETDTAIIKWIDARSEKSDNVNKSYLGFARRAIINSGVKHDDIAGLCHNMLVRQRGLVQVGAYNLYTMFNNTISIIRSFERAQKRGAK